jgi:hypothetical protein
LLENLIGLSILIPLLIISKIKIVKTKLRFVKNKFDIVIILYILMLLSATIINPDFLMDNTFNQYDIENFLYFYLIVAVGLIPIIFMKDFDINDYHIKKTKLLNFINIISCILILYSFIYHIPFVGVSIILGADAIRETTKLTGMYIMPENIYTTIAITISNFYIVFIYLFFLGLIHKKNKIILGILFTGGILYAMTSITFGGRDGYVFYILSLYFMFNMFKEKINKKTLKFTKKMNYIVFLFVFIMLAIFSIDRFDRTDKLLYGTIGYISQQPYVFIQKITLQKDFYGLDVRLPLFSKLLNGEVKELKRSKSYETSFATYIGDYFAINGNLTMWLIMIIQGLYFSLIFLFKIKLNKIFVLINLIIYFQLMMTGLFYFRLGSFSGNFYLIIMFSLSFLLPNFLSYIKNKK